MVTLIAYFTFIGFAVIAGFLVVGLIRALPYLIAITAAVLALMGFFYLLGVPLSLA
jgi:hypothetical protein